MNKVVDLPPNEEIIEPSCKIALVIGISDYSKCVPKRANLPKASHDAEDMAALLERF